MASPPSLLLLPLDIMNEIYSNLSYASLCAMELTCHTLHEKTSLYKSALQRKVDESNENKRQNDNKAVVEELAEYYNEDDDDDDDESTTTATTDEKPYTLTDLLEIETWPCYNFSLREPINETRREEGIARPDYFACKQCLRIRSAVHFTNSMLSRRKIHDSERQAGFEKYFRARKDKTCIDCCVERGAYRPGIIIRYGGWWLRGCGYGIVCISCGQFKAVEVSKGSGLSCGDCKELVLKEFRRRLEARGEMEFPDWRDD